MQLVDELNVIAVDVGTPLTVIVAVKPVTKKLPDIGIAPPLVPAIPIDNMSGAGVLV